MILISCLTEINIIKIDYFRNNRDQRRENTKDNKK